MRLLAPLKAEVDALAWIDWKNVYSESCPLNEKNLVYKSKIEIKELGESYVWAVAAAAAPGSKPEVALSRELALSVAAMASRDFQTFAETAARLAADRYLFAAAEMKFLEKSFVATHYFQLLPAAGIETEFAAEDFFYPDYMGKLAGQARLTWLYSCLDYMP